MSVSCSKSVSVCELLAVHAEGITGLHCGLR